MWHRKWIQLLCEKRANLPPTNNVKHNSYPNANNSLVAFTEIKATKFNSRTAQIHIQKSFRKHQTQAIKANSISARILFSLRHFSICFFISKQNISTFFVRFCFFLLFYISLFSSIYTGTVFSFGVNEMGEKIESE